MKETELKPCPFCGSEAVLNVEKISLYEGLGLSHKKYELRVKAEIRCTKCKMSGGTFTACIDIDAETAQTETSVFDTEAVKRMAKRWNRRADDEQREAER